jgi:chromate reductase, NAD(P)H dehydrogenase (quinone)
MAVRVLTISGSLQRASSNRAALDAATAAFQAADVEVDDFLDLAHIPPFNPGADPGPIVTDLRNRIAAADGVLIAAPEYAGALAGTIKNALDWIVGSGEFYLKPVAVTSAGSTGGPFARQHLIQTLTWQGAHVVAQLGISHPKTKSDAHGALIDPATLGEIDRLALTLATAPALPPEERLALVRAVIHEMGIDPNHIAPLF